MTLGTLTFFRCSRQATEHHHTRKPRSSFNSPEYVIHLCGGPRGHHRQVDAPFSRGRLLIVPRGDGSFDCLLVQGPDKWAVCHVKAR